VISKAGILFDKLERQGQRTLLQHMVKRVVINPEGQILRMELRAPFGYLHQLAAGEGGASPRQASPRAHKTQTSRDNAAGSCLLSLGGPKRNKFEPVSELSLSPDTRHLTEFLQAIEYPHQGQLAHLLTHR
jgi:hypothetical protein